MKHAYTQKRLIDLDPNTSAYAANDLIGSGEFNLPLVTNEGNGIVLQSVVGYDLDSQESALTLLFFSAEPSNTTFTNNAALDIADADLANFVGSVDIAADNYTTLADNSVFAVRNVGLAMDLPNDDLWVVVRCGGSPTYSNAANLKLWIVYWQD